MSTSIVTVDHNIMKNDRSRLVGNTVEDALNALLAEGLIGAECYERTTDCEAYHAGHYDCILSTASSNVTLRMPKRKGLRFATAIIDCRKRRETPVKEAMVEMYLAAVSIRRIESVFEIPWSANASASTASNLNDKALAAAQCAREGFAETLTHTRFP